MFNHEELRYYSAPPAPSHSAHRLYTVKCKETWEFNEDNCLGLKRDSLELFGFILKSILLIVFKIY